MGLSRREVLVAAAAAPFVGFPRTVRASTLAPRRARSARLAHLTDLHIQPERDADDGVLACLAHVNGLGDVPDAIVTGGDLVMDSFGATRERTELQWKLFTGAFEHAKRPVHHCLGNHDIWGWHKEDSKTTGTEPGWGKRWAIDLLGMKDRYHAFDLGAWRVVVLDSVREDPRDPSGYIGGLDDAQFEWLGGELSAAKGRPTVVVSHIPILCVPVMLTSKETVALDAKLDPSWIFADARRVVNLFAKHPQVKLCLSGHIHEIDRMDYQGVSYICDGAVSANWWKGRHKMCDEGYGVVDLNDDGSFEHQYVKYGWKARE